VPLDLADLLGSWQLHLRADRKSAQTVKSYGDGVRAYLKWCVANGRPVILDRQSGTEYVSQSPRVPERVSGVGRFPQRNFLHGIFSPKRLRSGAFFRWGERGTPQVDYRSRW
jgi:hypothetical protein